MQSLSQEDPLEEGKATLSSILAWRIPWTEESGGLQSIGSQSQTRLKQLSTTVCLALGWSSTCVYTTSFSLTATLQRMFRLRPISQTKGLRLGEKSLVQLFLGLEVMTL